MTKTEFEARVRAALTQSCRLHRPVAPSFSPDFDLEKWSVQDLRTEHKSILFVGPDGTSFREAKSYAHDWFYHLLRESFSRLQQGKCAIVESPVPSSSITVTARTRYVEDSVTGAM